jgi:hypothetical protein
VKGISAFVVERSWPGVGVGKKERKLGLRGSPTTEIVCENVKVPADCLIDKEAERLHDRARHARRRPPRHRLAVARHRRRGDRSDPRAPAAQVDAKGRNVSTQPDQWQIADLAADLDAYRFLTWRAAVLRDRGVALQHRGGDGEVKCESRSPTAPRGRRWRSSAQRASDGRPPPNACCATRASPRSTKAPPTSSASSSRAACEPRMSSRETADSGPTPRRRSAATSAAAGAQWRTVGPCRRSRAKSRGVAFFVAIFLGILLVVSAG